MAYSFDAKLRAQQFHRVVRGYPFRLVEKEQAGRLRVYGDHG
jgi:hypothetical protein